MRQVLSTAFATVLLLFVGCKKTDISVEADNSTSKATARTSSLVVATPICDVIDFENTEDFTFQNIGGANFLTSVKSQGDRGPIAVESYSPNAEDDEWGGPKQPATVLFDSDDPHEEDPDLGSSTLHNIAIIQNFDPEIFPEPNDGDENGAWMTFDFSNIDPVTVNSLTVIDVEANEGESITVNLYAGPGKTGLLSSTTYDDGVGQGNIHVMNLNTAGVGFMEVVINGSMGIDNIELCLPPTYGSGCTYTQGYWKTHGPGDCAKGNNTNAWPQPIRSGGVTFGNYYYSPSAMCSLFNTPVKGTNLGLAHQLFAAMLNSAKNGGAPSAAVQTCIDNAILFLANNGGATGNVSSNYLKSQREQLNTCLTNYNEGSHCN